MTKIEELRLKRRNITIKYKKDMEIIRSKIDEESNRILIEKNNIPKLNSHIVEYLRLHYTSDSISSVACEEVYNKFHEWTEYYKNISFHQFGRRMGDMGIYSTTKYIDREYIRVYIKST